MTQYTFWSSGPKTCEWNVPGVAVRKGGIKMTFGFLTRENFLVSMKDIFWGARLHISGSE